MHDLPTVVNKYAHTFTAQDIIIHRPSALGNPYSHKSGTLAKYKVNTREEAIRLYEGWLREKIENNETAVLQALARIRPESILICFCKPKDCHGDVIVRILDELWQCGKINKLTGDIQEDIVDTEYSKYDE